MGHSSPSTHASPDWSRASSALRMSSASFTDSFSGVLSVICDLLDLLGVLGIEHDLPSTPQLAVLVGDFVLGDYEAALLQQGEGICEPLVQALKRVYTTHLVRRNPAQARVRHRRRELGSVCAEVFHQLLDGASVRAHLLLVVHEGDEDRVVLEGADREVDVVVLDRVVFYTKNDHVLSP